MSRAQIRLLYRMCNDLRVIQGEIKGHANFKRVQYVLGFFYTLNRVLNKLSLIAIRKVFPLFLLPGLRLAFEGFRLLMLGLPGFCFGYI